MNPHHGLASPPHAQRPQRLRMADFRQKAFSLDGGKASYTRLDRPKDTHAQPTAHIIFGMAGLWGLAQTDLFFPSQNTPLYAVECEEFFTGLTPEQKQSLPPLPKHMQRIQPEDVPALLTKEPCAALWWYGHNTRLFPDFWWPILGQVLAQSHAMTYEKNTTTGKPVILLGVTPNQLLEQELTLAFTALGYEVMPVRKGGFSQVHRQTNIAQNPHEALRDVLTEVLHSGRVALFFSLNLQGLDAHGQDYALLHALRIPVALWFVDNPWHVLAALRLPWWKKCAILVTDASFIPALLQEGAEKVLHIPLATAQHMWQAQEEAHKAQYRNNNNILAATKPACIFVGRAAFPQKERFFAAAKVPSELFAMAQKHIIAGEHAPHFHWWAKAMQVHSFWQHAQLRHVGLGAEQSAQCQRMHWLQSFLPHHVAIFGDATLWQKLLPQAPTHVFHENVDYYGELSALYAAAPAVLNITSLLLPAGLTQRHFDVWAAGGFLFSNTTDGLNIFPKELVQAMAFSRAEDAKSAVQHMSHSTKEELKMGWQEHLRAKHSYEIRMKFVLENII